MHINATRWNFIAKICKRWQIDRGKISSYYLFLCSRHESRSTSKRHQHVSKWIIVIVPASVSVGSSSSLSHWIENGWIYCVPTHVISHIIITIDGRPCHAWIHSHPPTSMNNLSHLPTHTRAAWILHELWMESSNEFQFPHSLFSKIRNFIRDIFNEMWGLLSRN